jgi:hypothetical protein
MWRCCFTPWSFIPSWWSHRVTWQGRIWSTVLLPLRFIVATLWILAFSCDREASTSSWSRNGPSARRPYPRISLWLRHYVGCRQLVPAECRVVVWPSYGLINRCDEPWPQILGETLSKTWILKTSAGSPWQSWSLRSLRLHVSFGLLLPPTASWTPEVWFPGRVYSSISRVESLLCRIMSVAVHYWTHSEDSEPADWLLPWHPSNVSLACLLLFFEFALANIHGRRLVLAGSYALSEFFFTCDYVLQFVLLTSSEEPAVPHSSSAPISDTRCNIFHYFATVIVSILPRLISLHCSLLTYCTEMTFELQDFRPCHSSRG